MLLQIIDELFYSPKYFVLIVFQALLLCVLAWPRVIVETPGVITVYALILRQYIFAVMIAGVGSATINVIHVIT